MFVLRFPSVGFLSIFWSFAMLAPALAADDCPVVRLDQTPALRSIPRWDQEDSFLCYAFASSVVVDAHRLKDPGNQGTFSSPLALAADTIHFSRQTSRYSSVWGGNADQSLAVAAAKGTCRAGWLSDGFGELKLARLFPMLRAARKSAQTDLDRTAQELRESLSELGAKNVPDLNLLKELLRLGSDDFIPKLTAFLCEERLPPALPDSASQIRSMPGQPKFFDRVKEVLGREQPLAVEFCAEIVTDPKYQEIYGEPCAHHYAVIVGQRPGAAGCELLVRDSQCSQYKFKEGSPGCEDSHYWVNRDRLLSLTHSLHWLR